jgi:hypothetical protein
MDEWVPRLADQAFAGAPPEAAPTAGLNDYFDSLDAAFANLASPAPPAAPAAQVEAADAAAAAIDWYGTPETAVAPTAAPIADTWDLPAPPQQDAVVLDEAPLTDRVVTEPPPAVFEPPAPAVAAAPAPVVAPVAAAAPAASLPLKPAALPSLPDAFAALLAAEQGVALPSAAPVWPASTATSAITDEVLEDVTRRVLARLSDQVVRETISDIVSKTAERMIADEIARIKATIE